MADIESPSKTVLLEKRDERSLVAEGRSVLEERRDILAREMMTTVNSAVDEWGALGAALDSALAAVRGALSAHGPGGLRRRATTDSSPRAEFSKRNHFGTRLLDAKVHETAAKPVRGIDQSPAAALARRRMRELLLATIRHAATDNNLVRLDREFRRAQRKVNALDYVVLPSLQESIRYIEFALEEAERENMIRALGVKRRTD